MSLNDVALLDRFELLIADRLPYRRTPRAGQRLDIHDISSQKSGELLLESLYEAHVVDRLWS